MAHARSLNIVHLLIAAAAAAVVVADNNNNNNCERQDGCQNDDSRFFSCARRSTVSDGNFFDSSIVISANQEKWYRCCNGMVAEMLMKGITYCCRDYSQLNFNFTLQKQPST